MLFPSVKVLHFYFRTFRIPRAVPNMAVFSSPLTSCLSGMLPRYFLIDFCIVSVATMIIGVTFYIFHARYIFIVL